MPTLSASPSPRRTSDQNIILIANPDASASPARTSSVNGTPSTYSITAKIQLLSRRPARYIGTIASLFRCASFRASARAFFVGSLLGRSRRGGHILTATRRLRRRSSPSKTNPFAPDPSTRLSRISSIEMIVSPTVASPPLTTGSGYPFFPHILPTRTRCRLEGFPVYRSLSLQEVAVGDITENPRGLDARCAGYTRDDLAWQAIPEYRRCSNSAAGS